MSRATINPMTGFENYRSIRQYFNVWAVGKKYDSYDDSTKNYLAPVELSDRLFEKIERESLDIIDFACGTGLSGQPFINRGHKVDGIDLSEKMIAQAKSKGYRSTWNMNAATGDTSFLKDYDVALCVGCLGDYVLPHAIIPKMIQSLKNEAIIGFTIFDEGEIDFRKVIYSLNDAGFSNINAWRSLAIKRASIGGGHIIDTTYYDYFIAERKG